MARTKWGGLVGNSTSEDLVAVVPQNLRGVFPLPVTVGRAVGAERVEAEPLCSWTLWVGSLDRTPRGDAASRLRPASAGRDGAARGWGHLETSPPTCLAPGLG